MALGHALAQALYAVVIEASQAPRAAESVRDYTSKSPPPTMTRDHFNALCRRLHAGGDKRVRKVGRSWVASCDAFDVAPRRRRRAVTTAEGQWSPDDALEQAGIRSQRD